MMFEVADDDLVAGFDKGRAPALRDKVDRLGRAAHKDHLALVGGIEESAGLLAPELKRIGGTLAELIDPAMHVGIVATVKLGNAVDHHFRLLRAGAGVEKHQPRIVAIDRKL